MHFNVVVSGGLFYTFFILVLFMFEFVFIMFKHFLITDSVAYKPFHNVVVSSSEYCITENYCVAFSGRFECAVYWQQETYDEK